MYNINYSGFETVQVVKPYLLDLESTNKTYLNGEAIEPARYYEMKSEDIIKFADLDIEFVVIQG